MQIELSLVVPLYNEESNLPELYKRASAVMDGTGLTCELVLVNDGSYDRTLEIVKALAAGDNRVKYVSFSRNFGHQSAISAGMKAAQGAAIVTMDGDLQDPPELVMEMYQKFKTGYKVVYAKRKNRQGEGFFKKFTAKIFYRLLKAITSVDIPLDTGDFRLISKDVAVHLERMPETNKFLRGQIAWLGFKQTGVEYDRPDRLHGETKYTLRKMVRLAFNGITSFSDFPLRIASVLGFLFSGVAFLVILYALWSKFVWDEAVTGWTSLMIGVMFIGGIQLLCIGVIGEYLSRVGSDVRKRPDYIVEESNTLKD